MQIAGGIDGNNITYSHQASMALSSILGNGGVISGLDVTTNSVSAGKAIVRCTRTNGQVLMVAFENTASVTIDTTGTKKVWVEVTQAKIDDGSQNNEDGTWIAQIATGASYPSANFIPLGSIVGGVITSEKSDIYLTKKRKGLGANKVFATDSSGNEIEVAGTNGQVLGMSAGAVGFVSPTVNIDALAETTATAIDTDEFVVYSAADGVNKKKKMSAYKASDAEAIAGTVTDKFVNPAQAKLGRFVNTFSRVWTLGASNIDTTVITHNLGRPAKLVRVDSYFTINTAGQGVIVANKVEAWYDGTTQSGIMLPPIGGNESFTGAVFKWKHSGGGDIYQGTVLSNTNNALTISWSNGTPTGSGTETFFYMVAIIA